MTIANRMIPMVPQSIQVGENQFIDTSWKFVGRFTDEELRAIGAAWTEALLAEARQQREDLAPDEETA